MELEQIVKAKIDELDVSDMVNQIIRDQIRGDVVREIDRQVKEKVSDLIKIEFDIQMKMPVKTNDGWGKCNTYNSFEDLFRAKFAAALSDTWNVQKIIENTVSDRIRGLIKDKQKEITEKIANELLK